MSNSKLPVPQSRLIHDSPPVKNRKALNELTEMINYSPKYSAKASTIPSSIPLPKLDIKKTRKPQRTSIPQPSQPIQSVQISAQVKERMRSLSEAHSGLRLRDSKPRIGRFSTSSFQDPSAAKKDTVMEDRILKLIEVEKDKLHEFDKKINQAKRQNENFEKMKITLMRDVSHFKTQISDTEVGIINMEHKIESAAEKVRREKTHDEQMFTLKLKEVQNQMVRELDDFKVMMEQELANARNYKDNESQQEIVKLETELEELRKQADALRKLHENKLSRERALMEEKMEKVIQNEEMKGGELMKEYEAKLEKLAKLNHELDEVQTENESIICEIKKLDSEISEQKNIGDAISKSAEKLTTQISKLKLEQSELDRHLTELTTQSHEIDNIYEDSSNRLKKERHFRRRIENSIEDLLGKHRVYLTIPDDSHIEENDVDPSCELLNWNGLLYQFNKIFKTSDEFKFEEICSVAEYIFNGCNVSFILSGDDSTLTSSMLEQCHKLLHDRESRYLTKGWKFDYSMQGVNITPKGVFDIYTSQPCGIKVENRSITSTSLSRPLETSFELSSEQDSSTLIKLTLDAQSTTRSYTSHVYFLDLSHIQSLPLIQKAISKIQLNKYGSTEFDNPMYQLIHQLYANTKIVTLLNMDELNGQWLELGEVIRSVDVVPVKRVYR
jgi:chromosome segregation ATPase